MSDQRNQQKDNDLAAQVLKNLKNPPIEVVDPKGSGSNTKKYLLIVAVLVIIFALGGFAAWKFLLSKDKADSQEVPAAESQPEDEAVSPDGELSQEYVSDRLLIDIKHPASWKVDESSGEITVYSPETGITDFNGEKISAEFRLLVKQGATETDSEYLGRGFAISASEPIKYTDPSPNQRESSLITGFGLDSSSHFAYFVVQGNFNLKKNETLGQDFASEADEVLVSGGFYSKDSQDKTKLVGLDTDTYEENETYKTAIEIVKTLRLR